MIPALSFANPWGLLGLSALPAILVLHLYQRRFPRMAVAGLHLWGSHVEAHNAGPKRERLPITASLLLELFAALLLTLVVSRPRFDATAKAEHLVVVLDNSASMSARPDGESSFRDAAAEALKSRFEELPAGSVVTLLLTGRRPVMLAGPGIRPAEAIGKLSNWRPGEPQHDFQPAWDYAAQLADDTGRLLFVTDRLPASDDPAVPRKMEFLSVGKRCDNVAVTTAKWTLRPVVTAGKDELRGVVGQVFLWVHNFGERPATVEVVGRDANQQEVIRRTLQLPAKQGNKIDATVRGGIGTLTVTLKSANDELDLDSRITLVEPQLRIVRVAITLDKDANSRRYLEKVLRLLPSVQIVTKAAAANLRIGPAGSLPPSRDDLWWLGIGPLDPSAQAKNKSQRPSSRYPFLIERKHPLLKDVTLDGVRWAGVQPLKQDVTPLISAGGVVHLGQLKQTETTGFLLNIDLDESTLHQSEDWPILLHNLIEECRKSLPGLRESNYRQGQDVVFRLSTDRVEDAAVYNKPLTLIHGKQRRPVTRSRTIRISSLQQPGVYEIHDEGRSIGRFGVSFLDAQESDLTGLRPGRRNADDDSSERGFFIDQPFSLLLATLLILALAAIIGDWYVLRTRS